MERELGFVVVEFNQASGQPDLLPGAMLHTDRETAEITAGHFRDETAKVGRRERYAVATVTIEEED